MTQLRVAPLLALFADPVRIARLARVVGDLALVILLEVECDALQRLIARKHNWTTTDHDHTALGEIVRRKWSLDIIDYSLLRQFWCIF